MDILVHLCSCELQHSGGSRCLSQCVCVRVHLCVFVFGKGKVICMVPVIIFQRGELGGP